MSVKMAYDIFKLNRNKAKRGAVMMTAPLIYSARRKFMKELVMIIRPEKLEDIKKILDEIKCGGMTISTVMGCGYPEGYCHIGEGGQ